MLRSLVDVFVSVILIELLLVVVISVFDSLVGVSMIDVPVSKLDVLVSTSEELILVAVSWVVLSSLVDVASNEVDTVVSDILSVELLLDIASSVELDSLVEVVIVEMDILESIISAAELVLVIVSCTILKSLVEAVFEVDVLVFVSPVSTSFVEVDPTDVDILISTLDGALILVVVPWTVFESLEMVVTKEEVVSVSMTLDWRVDVTLIVLGMLAELVSWEEVNS